MKIQTLIDFTNIEKLREFKKNLAGGKLLPFFSFLRKMGIIPNHISMVGLFFNLLSATLIFQNHTLFAITSIIYFLLDGLDGLYARQMKLSSDFGHILDKTFDIFGGTVFYVFFWIRTNNNFILFVLAIYLLQNILMFILKLDKETGVSCDLRVFSVFKLFGIGICWDFFKFTIFTSGRVYLLKKNNLSRFN